jgi:glycine cleavage system H lipoate-binding protein
VTVSGVTSTVVNVAMPEAFDTTDAGATIADVEEGVFAMETGTPVSGDPLASRTATVSVAEEEPSLTAQTGADVSEERDGDTDTTC